VLVGALRVEQAPLERLELTRELGREGVAEGRVEVPERSDLRQPLARVDAQQRLEVGALDGPWPTTSPTTSTVESCGPSATR
jgi:hypothetical protein